MDLEEAGEEGEGLPVTTRQHEMRSLDYGIHPFIYNVE